MIKYDKLKNIKTEEVSFDFKCPSCGVDGHKKDAFLITPVGVSWKPDMIDNSDIKNEHIRKCLDALPTLREAVLEMADNNDNYRTLSLECTSCNKPVCNYNTIKSSDIRKWLNKHKPAYMDLRRK